MAPGPRLSSSPDSTVRFFTLTFVITWALQIPAVLGQKGLIPGGSEPYMLFAALGIFGPSLAAVVLTRRAARLDPSAPRAATLLKAPFRRPPLGLTVLALVVPALLLSGVLFALSFAGRQGPISYVPEPPRLIVGLVISYAEEVGWRGYALPRLQRRHGPFVASVILGVLWTLWHIPMFVGQGVSLTLLPIMFLLLIGGSLFYTWLYNRSAGNLALIVLAHFSAHLNNSHLALPADTVPALVHAIVYAALGFGLMAGAARRRRVKSDEANAALDS